MKHILPNDTVGTLRTCGHFKFTLDMKSKTHANIAGDHILFIHTVLLKIFGIFPEKIEGSKWIYLAYFCGIFECSVAFLLLISHLMNLPEAFISQNYIKIAVGINYLIMANSGLNKYYVLTMKQDIFEKLGEWTIITKNKHRNNNICKHLAEKVIAFLNPSLYFFTSFALVIWISMPFIGGPGTAVLLKLPNSWIPFLILAECMCMVFLATIILYGLFCEAHALALLCTEVAYISQNLRQLKYDNKHPSKFYENFVICLQEHTKALGIFREISIIYSEMFGFQVFISIISTCILIFGIVKKDVMANAIIYILPNTLATTFEFYFLCWLSEQATQELQSIHWTAYDNNWYDAPVAIRRPLGILLEISKTPIYLKGANVINASLNTFVEAMKQGFSLYTALKVVTSDE